MIIAPTYSQFLDEIKRECRIFKSNDLDDLIKTIIQDEVLNAASTRPFELFVPDTTIQCVDGQRAYDLPDDFYMIGQVDFEPAEGGAIVTLTPKNDHTYYRKAGSPRWFFLEADETDQSLIKISVFPFTLVTDADYLAVYYYKKPTFGDDPDNVFPFLRFLPTVRSRAISRIQAFNKDREALEMSKLIERSADQAANMASPYAGLGELPPVDTRKPDLPTS